MTRDSIHASTSSSRKRRPPGSLNARRAPPRTARRIVLSDTRVYDATSRMVSSGVAASHVLPGFLRVSRATTPVPTGSGWNDRTGEKRTPRMLSASACASSLLAGTGRRDSYSRIRRREMFTPKYAEAPVEPSGASCDCRAAPAHRAGGLGESTLCRGLAGLRRCTTSATTEKPFPADGGNCTSAVLPTRSRGFRHSTHY